MNREATTHAVDIPISGAYARALAVPVHCDELVLAPELREAARINPDHHLWQNKRFWWIAFTIHKDQTQKRIRSSLRTADLKEARRRRDRILQQVVDAPHCSLAFRVRALAQGAHERRGAAPLAREAELNSARDGGQEE